MWLDVQIRVGVIAFVTSYIYLELEDVVMSLSSLYFQQLSWCWYLVATQSNIC